jgi:hypothetical protein
VSGLFGQGGLPGAVGSARSPMFQSPAGPGLEMSGRASVLSTAAQVRSLGTLLASPNFLPCLTQYESALVAGAVAGATVQTQPVTLPTKPGTQAFGVVTTYTLPGAGSEVVGQAFLLGGRVLSVITPTTSGAPIPSDVFAAVYGKVLDRVAAASGR